MRSCGNDSQLHHRLARMTITFPFLTSYDPPGTSEGTLDPLGLYQIADQLAVQLVPAVRERMQRIRFLTAMAVGAMVTEGIENDPEQRDASPYLIWEWLVVEALIRTRRDDPGVWGVPGTLVARRALDQHGYIDARSYLKTPRIFGFNGVYKRLAAHLGLVDVHLGAGPNAERLVNAWARGLGLGGLDEAKPILGRWSAAVRRSLNEKPPRTRQSWGSNEWAELAGAFAPAGGRAREKACLRDLLHSADERRLGALPTIWQLQSEFEDDGYREEVLHDRLEKREPSYGQLLGAIRAYEAFARSLQDAFDLLKAEAARPDAQGFAVPEIESDADFKRSVKDLHDRFEAAHRALGEVTITSVSLQNLFSERFRMFAEPMEAGACARALCAHHEAVQRAKSAAGKRPWFDRLGQDRIYIRHAYREARSAIQPGRYVHDYRGLPIRRFYRDLS
jgi:hypothetical protein